MQAATNSSTLPGHKRIFPYRIECAGARPDGRHARRRRSRRCSAWPTSARMPSPPACTPICLQRKYPHAEISFSCPRLRPIMNNDKINPKDVHERQLLQVMCAYRIFMPFAGP